MEDNGIALLTQLPAARLASILLAMPPVLAHRALLALPSATATEALLSLPTEAGKTLLAYIAIPQAEAFLKVTFAASSFSKLHLVRIHCSENIGHADMSGQEESKIVM